MTIMPACFQSSKLHRNSFHTIICHKRLKWSLDPTIKPQPFLYILPSYEPFITYDHLMMLSGAGTARVIKNRHVHLDRNPTDPTLSTKNSLGCFLYHYTTLPCTLSSDVNVWSLRAFLSIQRYENHTEKRPGCMKDF